jgi:arylsulfatase A-like enzyme/predicted Zn-dependent protease
MACLTLLSCSGGEDPPAGGPSSAASRRSPAATSDTTAGQDCFDLLLLTLDTTRADHLSCYGEIDGTTPNLDRLASDGVLFTEAYTPVPITLPSHATMMTGLYPYQHGVRANGVFVLGDDHVTLAELLQGRGYDTGAILGAFPLDSRFGLAQGFATYDDRFSGASRRRGGQMAERTAREVTRLALAWLDRPRERPFFLWCHYFDPHAPYEPPEPQRSRFPRSGYTGEIAAMDAAIGELLDGLADRDLLRRTVVVVAGDHGESLGEHGELTHAFYVYDATLRVPLLLRMPPVGKYRGAAWRGQRIDGAVDLTDLLPTACDALGLSPDGLPPLAGRSLLPMIARDDRGREQLYHECLVPQLDYGASDLRSLRVGRWKYIRAPRPELYDLAVDPGERHDLAGEQPARVEALEQQLQAILRDESRPSTGPALDPQTRDRLRSLGYVAGGQGTGGSPGGARDPKDLCGYAQAAERAFDLSRDHHQTQALALVDSLLTAFAGPVFLHELRGRILLDLERPVEALAATDEALDRCGDCPQRADLRLQRAMATLAAGRPDEALAQTQTLLRSDEQLPGTWLFLAEIWQYKGDLDRARQALSSEADRWPDDPLPLLRLGELEAQAGRPDAAAAAYRRALARDPHHAEALTALSMVLAGEGEAEQAAALLDRALAADPTNPRACRRQGILLQEEGRQEEAARWFATASREDPADPLAATLLGVAYLELDRQEEALAALRAAVATGRAPQETYVNLGVALSRQGLYDEAIAAWQEGIARDPEGPYLNRLHEYIRGGRDRLQRGAAPERDRSSADQSVSK